MEYNVIHNPEQSRFEMQIDGLTAVVDYILIENVLNVTHTIVPSELEGRGIAAALTKTILNYARENKLKVIPSCSYTRAYITRKGDEYKDLVENREES